MSEIVDVLVIGGGAAGLMAAGQSAVNGKKVLLLEKNNTLAAKLKISGGGRCNITNAEFDARTMLSHYGNAGKFLFSSFSQFGVEETFSFFTSHGLPLVVQANNRAFPKTQKAYDVYETLMSILRKENVRIKTGCIVKRLVSEGKKIVKIETNLGTIQAKSIILATGGVSHPETGSTGDGFRWLKELGHSVKTPTLTIVPLAVKEKWVKSLAGVSIQTMRITFYLDGKKQFSKVGSLLFTHFGISGPLVLNSSSKISDLLQEGKVEVTIDVFPDIDIGALEKRVLTLFDENKNKIFKTVLKEIVPAGTTPGILMLLDAINPETKVHSITKEERKIIVNTLKSLPLTISYLMGKDRAVAADGGVILEEVDMRTMRSKLYENLYIIGDLLHINRPSGGYSLQLCWTTGYIAGNHV